MNGSKEYKIRFEKAVAEFMDGRVDWTSIVSSALAKPIGEYKEQTRISDDEEAWMWISEKDLTDSLESYHVDRDDQAGEGVEDEMREITNDFDRFINVKSGLDGVVFDEEDGSDDDSDEDMPIEFDGDRYIAALKALCEERKEDGDGEEKVAGTEEEETMEEYMQALDNELGSSKTVGETFGDNLDENGEVDVSINLLRNIVTSSLDQSDTGEFGPFDGILQGMNR
jgi:hypothetical protein